MSEDVFVLVFAARYYKATARFIFRDLCKQKCLNDNLINMIHERYMVFVHLDENARSIIYAALARAWVQQTLRVPITQDRERYLLILTRHAHIYKDCAWSVVTSLIPYYYVTVEKRAASNAVRATEIARIGPMMKIPDWVEAVVFFT